MPIELAASNQGLPQRLLGGLRYPLHGAALATCVALAVARYTTLIPLIGIAFDLLLWAATFGYAIDCLIRSADGYAKPPEISLAEGRAGSPGRLLVLHMVLLALLYVVALANAGGALTWALFLATVVVLPAIDMSLAFDGSLLIALNPATWARVAKRFGAAYAIPVLANLALVALLWLAALGANHLPRLLAISLFGFAATWLLILDFHWMGLLVWHYRERAAMPGEAPELAMANDDTADAMLVAECEAQAASDPEAAAIRLSARIRERAASTPVHTLFRRLLRQLGRTDLLVKHGRYWIAQLADEEPRRALGVLRECIDLDADFTPGDPDRGLALARLAARIGMRHLATGLARACLKQWPQCTAAAELRHLAGDA